MVCSVYCNLEKCTHGLNLGVFFMGEIPKISWIQNQDNIHIGKGTVPVDGRHLKRHGAVGKTGAGVCGNPDSGRYLQIL